MHFVRTNDSIPMDKLMDHAHFTEEGYSLPAKILSEKLVELGLEP